MLKSYVWGLPHTIMSCRLEYALTLFLLTHVSNMAVTKKPTKNHRGGDGKPPSKKPPTDKGARGKANKEWRMKHTHDNDRSSTYSKVDTEVIEQTIELPTKV